MKFALLIFEYSFFSEIFFKSLRSIFAIIFLVLVTNSKSCFEILSSEATFFDTVTLILLLIVLLTLGITYEI